MSLDRLDSIPDAIGKAAQDARLRIESFDLRLVLTDGDIEIEIEYPMDLLTKWSDPGMVLAQRVTTAMEDIDK